MTLPRHLNSDSQCQNWYPQLARTGMAVFQLPFPTFRSNLSGVLCTETVEATMPMAVKSYHDVPLGWNTPDHVATAVISLAHSPMTYWSCFAIHKLLRHLKNTKLLLKHGIYTCIYCVKIFSWWNIPKRIYLKLKVAKISVQCFKPFSFTTPFIFGLVFCIH